MSFEGLPEFQKEYKRLKGKYLSIPKDLEEFKRVLMVEPLGTGKHFAVLTKSDVCTIVKARFFCRYLRGSSLRIVYALHDSPSRIVFIELYFKGDKESEDSGRWRAYLRES